MNIVATCRLTDTWLVFQLLRWEILRRGAFHFGKEVTENRNMLPSSAE